MTLPVPISAVLAVLVLAAAWTDGRSRTIPNWLTVGGIGAGFAAHVAIGGLGGLKAPAAGFALAAGVYGLFYVLRAVGGGDLKLMAAVGAIAGPSHWFSIFIGSALLGGLMAVTGESGVAAEIIESTSTLPAAPFPLATKRRARANTESAAGVIAPP